MENNLAPSIATLLDLLSLNGGKIVCTSSLSVEWINQAKASGRMWVDGFGIGFVWEPSILRLPETEKEVEDFERWFPLKVEVPDDLSTWEKLQERIKKTDLIKKQKKEN